MVRKYINIRIAQASSVLGLDLPYFLGGGFWLTAATIASAIGGIFLSALFARIWPPDVYGQFSFLMSALGFVSLTALPGMGQTVLQASAENRDGVWRVAMKLVFKWSLFGTAILIAGSAYFFFRQNQNLAMAVIVSAVVFPISTTGTLYTSFLSGKKKFKKVAIFSTISQFTSIMATALALWLAPTLVVITLVSTWSTAIITLILTYLAQAEVKNKKVDKKILNFGKHLSLSQILISGSEYLDRFLVPAFLGFTNNAIYAFAILIPMNINSFLKIFLTLGQPKVAQIDKNKMFGVMIKKSLLLGLLILGIIILYIIISPIIFDALYPAYKNSSLKLSQLFAIGLIFFPGNLFGLMIIKLRGRKVVYKTNLVHAIVSVSSLMILIPTFGLEGAIFSRVLTKFAQAASQIYFAKILNQLPD